MRSSAPTEVLCHLAQHHMEVLNHTEEWFFFERYELGAIKSYKTIHLSI